MEGDGAQLSLFQTELSPTVSEAPESPEPEAPETGSSTGRHPETDTAPFPRRVIEAASSRKPEVRALFDHLQERLGGRLRSLKLTDNRRTILSVRPAHDRDSDGLAVRLHRGFVGAPDAVLAAVVVLVDGPRDRELRTTSRRAVRRWMDRFWAEHGPPERRRTVTLQPVGETLDLRELRDDLNRRFFEGRLSVHITWSQVFPGTVCRTRSIRLGSFQEDLEVVRIHPALDRPGVPRYVVESIVHHELLHADIPAVIENGRRYVHTPEFRRRERRFPEHRRAQAWIRKNLKRLLRY
jgi:predicted metal-dependent hydrolase